MQVAAFNPSSGSDSGIRSGTAKAVRPPEPGAGPFEHTVEEMGGWRQSQLPGLYLLLLSRIENAQRASRQDLRALEQMERLLERRLADISAANRRRLARLPGFQRLGLDGLGALPRAVRAGMQDASRAAAILALLKHPAFVAAMKDLPNPALYGPRGLLRAS